MLDFCYKCWWEKPAWLSSSLATPVGLKSGGPAMAVQKIISGSQVLCQWFDRDKNPKGGVFHPDSLELYEAGPGIVVG
jgi:uncharacterized protein YodC (DUF2158 family)